MREFFFKKLLISKLPIPKKNNHKNLEEAAERKIQKEAKSATRGA
jgi:hypothetical protein